VIPAIAGADNAQREYKGARLMFHRLVDWAFLRYSRRKLTYAASPAPRGGPGERAVRLIRSAYC